MKLLFQYIKQYKKILFGALLLATINQVFSLLDPQIFRLIVDNYASKVFVLSKEEFLNGILWLLLASMGVAFVSRIAKNFQDYFVSVISQRVGTQLYSHSVEHSFSLPYSAFEDQRSGELLQKLQKARADSQALISSFVNVVFLSFIGIAFVVGYAFTVHWLVGLVYFLIIPVLGSATFFISRRIKIVQKSIVRESAELAGSTTETLRNVELVKSLGLETQEISRLNKVNNYILELELKKIRLIRALSFLQGTLINAIRSALLFLMLWLVFQRSITIGEFFSLFVYSFFVFTPLAEFGNVSAQFQEAKASMENLETILNIKSEEKPSSAQSIDTLRKIEFRNVSFSYQSSSDASISTISMKINAGDTVAFVGPSGSGKTTLIKLLLGLYKPSMGALLYNDIDSLSIDYEKLRSKIGFVSQETQLFAGTIRENLLFVNPKASEQDCFSALRLASAMSIVERGDKGLDTKIGEGGIKISGGERQRLAIARAMLRDPDLIIFDEATSSLDSITEKAITKTIQDIEREKKNAISVLIAHRLSTIMHAKKIYVLEKGVIIEEGTHEELLSRQGLYSALWREQSAERGI